MTSRALCMVGLPGAGKTTYLAAFWAVARDASGNRAYELVRFPPPGTRKYLQMIADDWFAGRVVERNTSTSLEPIEIDLRSGTGRELTLRIPDLSGEAFRDAAAVRTIDERVADLVATAELILFFVNAASATAPVSLADLDPGDDSEPAGEPVEFDPVKLETDILNAELLQLLPVLTEGRSTPSIAVVVSAWDQIEDLKITPLEWLSTNQPMFSQTLAEYNRHAATTVIGISAQGGDYATGTGVAQKAPSTRPVVVTDQGRSTEIAAPLVWFDELASRQL